jgi:hypothetical protein
MTFGFPPLPPSLYGLFVGSYYWAAVSFGASNRTPILKRSSLIAVVLKRPISASMETPCLVRWGLFCFLIEKCAFQWRQSVFINNSDKDYPSCLSAITAKLSLCGCLCSLPGVAAPLCLPAFESSGHQRTHLFRL